MELLFPHSPGGQKPEVEVSAGLVPSGGLKGECFPACSSLEAAWIPWLTAPSQHHDDLLLLSSQLPLLAAFLSPSYKEPLVIGPTWVIQDSLPS